MHRLVVFVVGLTALQTIAACDTGDGKTLRPVDPGATTTSSLVASIDTGTLLSAPLQTASPPLVENALGIPTDSPSLEGFEIFAPWADGGAIDPIYTCDGGDISPALSWKSPPAGTNEVAFAFVDETATAGSGPFIHWVLAGVRPDDIALTENVVPVGGISATNSFGTVGWSGPCPPEGGGPHEYRLTMYALNQQVELADGTPAAELLAFIETVAIGSTDLSATYQR